MKEIFLKILGVLKTFFLGKKNVQISAVDWYEAKLGMSQINLFRQDNALLPLKEEYILVQLAVEHSKYMATYNTLTQDLFPANLDFKLRYFRKHFCYKTISAVKTTTKADDFVEKLRSHQDIRAKLLSSNYDLFGVAECEGYWTLIMTSQN